MQKYESAHHGDLPYESAKENWDYYSGDTFQFWTGPKPPADHPDARTVMRSLEEVFHSHNVIGEAIDHYVAALVGQPFNFYLSADKPMETLTDAQKRAIDAEEEFLQKWWDYQKERAIESGRGDPIAGAVTQLLVTGRGYLRLYRPARVANDPEPYRRMILHCPAIGSVATERDADGFLYEARYDYDPPEGGSTGDRASETYTLLENGKTRIQDSNEPREVDYGGRLPIFEMRGKSVITPSAKQGQNSINKVLTIKDVNVDAGGFLSRVLINAQLPGEFVTDPNQPNGRKFVPSDRPLTFGPRQVTYVQGMPLGDPDNPSSYTTPSLITEQPIDAGVFGGSLAIDYEAFWLSIGLGHLLTAGDGSLSGRSRETIKGDFEVRLQGYAGIVESSLKAIFQTVQILLADLYNRPSLKEYSCVVELNLTTGKALPEERNQAIVEYQSKLRSRTGAMMAIGISDPDAEIELMQRETETEIAGIAKLEAEKTRAGLPSLIGADNAPA
jgi:hypothetical protein